MAAPAAANVARKVFLIATEESGDRLGANLMKVLRQRLGGAVRFEGVGGQSMAREGLASLFPIEELSIMGFSAVVKELPKLLRLIRETAAAVTQAAPDILVIIDSPDFTHRVARRVRARDPSLPIIDYVSPTVWAWRPGRARAMLGYVDHVLALLPFEPEAYRRLHGPPCSYVGHPLVEQIDVLRPDADEQRRRDGQPPVLLVLPGSRRGEINRHMAVFGETLGLLDLPFEAVLPTLPHLQDLVRESVKSWPVQPRIIVGEQEKKAAFRIARAAFVKSGTATLELALAGVPMVAAYKVGAVEAWILRRAIQWKFGDFGKSRDWRECGAGIPPGGLHAGETGAGVARHPQRLALAATTDRSLCGTRRHHVDRRRAAQRPGRRHRAGDVTKGAGTRISALADGCGPAASILEACE